MMQFVCETCGAIKRAGEPWILGFAVERLGTKTMSRDITLAPAWDENKAVQWFAVHFCSVECKDDYVARLFGTTIEKKVVVKSIGSGRKTAAKGRVVTKTRRRVS